MKKGVEIQIRKAKPSDIDRIMEIEEESFPSPWSRVIFASEIAKGNVFVAEIGEEERKEIVGYIVLEHIIDEVHLENIAVDRRWRRKGIGKKLIEFALKTFPKCQFFLEVRPSNKPAISLYKKFGFVEVGRRKKYYGDEDAVIMVRIPKLKKQKIK